MEGGPTRVVVLLRPKPKTEVAILDRCERAGLSAALWLKHNHGAEVSAVAAGTLGPSEHILRVALRAGTDRAIHLAVPQPETTDYLGIARVIAAHLQREGVDAVLCGACSEHDRVGALGPAVAELCSLPHLSHVTDVVPERKGKSDTWSVLMATQHVQGELHTFRCALPIVLCVRSFTRPPSATARCERSNASIETRELSELNVAPSQLSVRADFIGEVSPERGATQPAVLRDAAVLAARLRADGLQGW